VAVPRTHAQRGGTGLGVPVDRLSALFDDSIGSGEYSHVRALRTPSTSGETDERPTLSKSLSLSRGVSVRVSDASCSEDTPTNLTSSSTDSYQDARVQLTPSVAGSTHVRERLSAAHAFETRSLERLMRRSLASASSAAPPAFSLDVTRNVDTLYPIENVRDVPTPSSVGTLYHESASHSRDWCLPLPSPLSQGFVPSKEATAKSTSLAYTAMNHGCDARESWVPMALGDVAQPAAPELRLCQREWERRPERERERESTAESEPGCTEIYTLKSECTRLVTRMQQTAPTRRHGRVDDAPVRSGRTVPAASDRAARGSRCCRCRRAPTRRRCRRRPHRPGEATRRCTPPH
jgi:hypothetical protein